MLSTGNKTRVSLSFKLRLFPGQTQSPPVKRPAEKERGSPTVRRNGP